MFEDDDDDDQDYFEDEFYDWRNTYEFYFPKELAYGSDSILYDFYKTKYTSILTELVPEIRELLYLHYPETETELRPLIVDIIEIRLKDICIRTLIDLFVLFYYEQNGFDLKEKYPELDEWATHFAKPIVPYKNMDETFEKLNLTREQKRGIIAEMYKDEFFIDRKIRHRGEFIHAIQKVIFRHYPLLDTLSSNGWIVFSKVMYHQFFEYKFHFDILGNFIAFKLPEEDIHLNYGELQKKFDVIYQEKLAMEQNKS
jgi:hypothetical protein